MSAVLLGNTVSRFVLSSFSRLGSKSSECMLQLSNLPYAIACQLVLVVRAPRLPGMQQADLVAEQDTCPETIPMLLLPHTHCQHLL